jgi:hypothetical protein
MRDYGVVRTRFWDWAKRKKLSPEAKEMALYLLTCPHANSLGCFRLPIAYVCDDLGKTAEEASDALATLDVIGFLRRDAESGWTWIPGYLEHNPIPNGKVGKAAGKMLEHVPGSLAFYADLLASLHGVMHFPPDLIDELRKRYLVTQDTVSPQSGTHTPTQTPTHDPTPTHDHTSERADALEADSDEAYRLFLEAAKANGWPEPRKLDPDRKRKLKARLAEHELEGWKAMLERAARSEFLKTEFRLSLDWVLEPRNFRKVLDGNYDPKKPVGAPRMQTMAASDDNWSGRMKGWRESSFWMPTWGPEPGQPGCFVPKEFLQ